MEVSKIAEELNNCNQALCIVNSKKHTIEIYSKLSGEVAFHLSTRMCPKHRSEVLTEIKKRLKDKRTCRVVSTQLIEAGVDVAKSNMDRFEDILYPQAIKAYFEELYTFEGEEGLDINNIFNELEKGAEGCNFNFNFKQVASKFKLIDENIIPIIVQIDNKSKELINKLRFIDEYKSILRAIQPYTVNVYENEFNKMHGANMIEVINDGIYVLRDINIYNEKAGLEFTVETGIGIFIK